MHSNLQSTDFVKDNFPELLEESIRIKYFVKYEYPNKQKDLFAYWPKTLDKYLENYLQTFCVTVDEAVTAFTLQRARPSCLPAIFHELTKEDSESNYLVLENLHQDQQKQNFVVDKVKNTEKSNTGFFGNLISPLKDSFSNMLGFSNPREEIKSLSPNAIIVNKKFIAKRFREIQKKLKDIFDTSEFLSIEDFDAFATTLMNDFSYQDLKILKYLLISSGDIHEVSLDFGKSKKRFYTTIKKKNTEELKMQTTMFELRVKINNLDIQMDGVANQIKEMETEVFAKLKQKNQNGAKRVLKQKKRTQEMLQNLINRNEMLQKCLFSLENLHNEADFSGWIKVYNNTMEKTNAAYEEVHDAIENSKRLTEQQNTMNEYINDESNSDLDDEFERIEKEIIADNKNKQNLKPVMKPIEEIIHEENQNAIGGVRIEHHVFNQNDQDKQQKNISMVE